MFFPTVQQVVDKLLAPVGWGTLATSILAGLGYCAKLLWTLTTNHAEHIQASAERIEQKQDTLITLAQTQNLLMANQTEASKDAAVTLAEIKTLLSLK